MSAFLGVLGARTIYNSSRTPLRFLGTVLVLCLASIASLHLWSFLLSVAFFAAIQAGFLTAGKPVKYPFVASCLLTSLFLPVIWLA